MDSFGDMKMTDTPWPKHPDGRNKRMGEMTKDERRAQWQAAGQRLQAEFNDPGVKARLAAALSTEST